MRFPHARTALPLIAAATVAAPASAAPAKPPAAAGIVWTDGDADGIRDTGEKAVTGVTVRLERRSGKSWKTTRTTKTGKTGRYSLALPAGTAFRVVVAAPADQTFTGKRKGKSRTKDSDVDASGASARFARRAQSIDAGLLPKPAPTSGAPAPPPPAAPAPTPPPADPGPGGTVTGVVWRETTVDGRRTAGEPASAAALVQLWDEARSELLATTTSSIAVDAGLRYLPPVAVTGYVWRDGANDGVRADNDPAGSTDLELWTADRTQRLATLDASGAFSIVAPYGGVSVVLRAVSSHQILGRYRIGGDLNRDSDIHPPDDKLAPASGGETGDSDPFTLPTTGGSVAGFGVAVLTPAAVGNLVWQDTDEDGHQDVGEPGRANVTVQAWNEDRTILLGTTTTDADGAYRFFLRGPDDYALRVLKPSALWRYSPKDVGNDLEDSDVDSSGWADVEVATNTISITSIDAGIYFSTLIPAG